MVKRIVLIFIILLLQLGHVHAQSIFPIDSMEIAMPSYASSDKIGNIYVSNFKGEIQKYNSFGQLLGTYESQNSVSPEYFDAWQMLRVFVYNTRSQEYFFLDHLLNTTPTYSFGQLTQGFVQTATTDDENSLWLVDDSSLSLKRFNLYNSQLRVETDLRPLLDDGFEIYHMKAHQNHLFMSEKKSGILVFDNMGNFIQKLPFDHVKYFGFYGNYIYYHHNLELFLYHIKTKDQIKIDLPVIMPVRYCFITDNQLFILSNDKFYHYRIVGLKQ